MSVVTYHYKVFKSLQVPIITLAISYGDTWYPVEAYVDSGATYSVFTARVADRLGLTYRTGQRKFVQVGDGAFIPVYLHDLKIQLGKHRLVVPVGLSEKLGIRFNLLGRIGIFNHFKVCFDEQRFIVTLHPYA
jgi:predicted aspartyl protease